MPTIRISTKIAAPVERCFDLSRSIDLHQESMAQSRERAIAGVTSGLIGLGDEVTWEARHFGINWRMTSRIVEFHPNNGFVDEMVRGPFSKFRHEHYFEPADRGTLMLDCVDFRTWPGPQRFCTDIIATMYLRMLLRSRNDAIKSRAESTMG